MPGSPHPSAQHRRQGSPHPSAMVTDSPRSRSASPTTESPLPTNELALQPLHEDIPDLATTAPAIFVPATYDYTQPQPTATNDSNDDGDTTARVDRALAELEEHMNAVKRNISGMVLQQARRVHQEQAAAELFHLQRSSQQLSPLQSRRPRPTAADEAAMLQSLATPCQPGRAYGIPPTWSAAYLPCVVPHGKDTPREALVVLLGDLMRFGTVQMDNYETNCVEQRRELRQRIAREIAEEKRTGRGRGAGGGGAAPVATMQGGDNGDDTAMDLD